jgi:hypothetical protein
VVVNRIVDTVLRGAAGFEVVGAEAEELTGAGVVVDGDAVVEVATVAVVAVDGAVVAGSPREVVELPQPQNRTASATTAPAERRVVHIDSRVISLLTA